MKSFYKIMSLMLSLMVGLSSCDNSDGNSDITDNVQKESTYLLYIVGENDLTSYLEQNINDIKLSMSQSPESMKSNVLIYADISATPQLYLIERNSNGIVSQRVIKTYPDQMSTSTEVMRNVIKDVFTLYPSEKNGITFSSHASGSIAADNSLSTYAFGMEYKDGVYYSMNVSDMREAIEGSGVYFDFIMFDACLMASIETAYELKDCASYLLAAPNSVPGGGFPYSKMFSDLLLMDSEGLIQAASKYMYHYENNSERWDDFVSISVTDLSYMETIANMMDSVSMDVDVQKASVKVKLSDMQKFEKNFELYDFGLWLNTVADTLPARQKLDSLLQEAVIYSKHNEYAAVNSYTAKLELPIKEGGFCGLNTYLPDVGAAGYYDILQKDYFTTLRWYRDAGLYRFPLYAEY